MQTESNPSAPVAVQSSAQRIHVVGLGGAGVSALVHLLNERGVKITGSDQLESEALERLRSRGIACRVGHASVNVADETQLVLISAAVTEANPEVVAARERRIPVLKYAELLGSIMAERDGIAVAGTHGKTTTTAMVAHCLRQAGLDPSFVIGGEHPSLGGSSHWGSGKHFVAEACEFDRSFLHLKPKISIVTNIEEDHLDYFRTLKEIQGAFASFSSLLPEDGCLVMNRDDPNSSYLSEFCRSEVATFSLRPFVADWWAEAIQSDEGGSAFVVVGPNGERARFRLRVPGRHNIYNALAATAACHRVGVPLASIAEILETYGGVRRRFERLADGRVLVIDDYAHHPTEVAAVLSAARESLPGRRLVAVFQPHQHSRLKLFRSQFARALSGFDVTLVTSVYRARDNEEDARSVQSDSLVASMLDLRPRTVPLYTPGFGDTLKALREIVRAGDAVLFLGAGSITDLAKLYAREVAPASADGPCR